MFTQLPQMKRWYVKHHPKPPQKMGEGAKIAIETSRIWERLGDPILNADQLLQNTRTASNQYSKHVTQYLRYFTETNI